MTDHEKLYVLERNYRLASRVVVEKYNYNDSRENLREIKFALVPVPRVDSRDAFFLDQSGKKRIENPVSQAVLIEIEAQKARVEGDTEAAEDIENILANNRRYFELVEKGNEAPYPTAAELYSALKLNAAVARELRTGEPSCTISMRNGGTDIWITDDIGSMWLDPALRDFFYRWGTDFKNLQTH